MDTQVSGVNACRWGPSQVCSQRQCAVNSHMRDCELGDAEPSRSVEPHSGCCLNANAQYVP